MWILELAVKNVPKITKICALRNSQIVFSRRRGFIFQGFQHFLKLAKIASKWRLNWAPNRETVVRRPLKHSFEKHIKKRWTTCPKHLLKWGQKHDSLEVFWGLEAKVLPGWSQGLSQAPPRVESARKRCQNGDQMSWKSCVFRGSTEGQML